MNLSWRILDDAERSDLANILVAEGEQQGVIGVVSDRSKKLSVATIQTIDDLKAIVMHDLAKRSGFVLRTQLTQHGQSLTIGANWDRMKAHNVQFTGDWLNDWAQI
jgi:hypothetical protein